MRNRQNTSPIISLIIYGAIIAATPFYYLAYVNSERTVTATVSEKTVKRSSNRDKYLVFTDQEIFEVVDSWFYLDWRASDRYADIPVNTTCDFRVAGWRWGWMSWYPNILEVKHCR